MAEPIISPVQLGFSEFVAKLVSDTFEAVISSTYSQEENWMQLNELLLLDLDEFTVSAVDDEMLSNEMNRIFPDKMGGTSIVIDGPYQEAKPDNGKDESPPIKYFTGFQPKKNKLTSTDVDEIYRLVRLQIGKRQYGILSKMMSKGNTKVIVDAGKINAKLNFEILQLEETEIDDSPASDVRENEISRIFVKRKFPGFAGLTKPTELKNVHFFVKPPKDEDPQTHQVKANVYGEVEIQFKTIS